ncbi:MAG: TerB family tellurite resistance protein [Kiritimatiellae bacterium]|nr:TerB family tellurite resistance protein [Kiritimatiellia bacterium]
MNNDTLFEKMKDFFGGLVGKRFCYGDAVLLKTALMLAAVDGEVSDAEVARFKEFAKMCRGYNDTSFEKLWEKAMRSAGYLYLQSRFLSTDELVAAFVEEAKDDFIDKLSMDTYEEREEAFNLLEKMAMADGEYSEVERKSIAALNAAVQAERDRVLADRYTRVTVVR